MDTMKYKDFPSIFRDFTAEIGEPDAGLDDNGDYELLLDEDLIVNIHYDQELENVLIFALIADIDGIPEREEFLTDAMRSNYFWEDNQGFTLAMRHDTEEMVLFGQQSAMSFTSQDAIGKYIETFADVVFHWRNLIAEKYMEQLQEQSNTPIFAEEDN